MGEGVALVEMEDVMAASGAAVAAAEATTTEEDTNGPSAKRSITEPSTD